MTAQCIISFDCEGKWGISDCIGPHHLADFTNVKLEQTYRDLIAMLDHHHIKATFGFVTAFTFSREQYHAFAADFRDVMIGSHVWRHQLHLDIQNDTVDGWFSPESLAIVQAAGVHEIASHGFTHVI